MTSREALARTRPSTKSVFTLATPKARPNVPVVPNDHKLLGIHFQQDQFGGFVNYPLISDLVDEALFLNLKKQGLKDANVRHLMYAISNDCDRFITTDPDFLDRNSVSLFSLYKR